MLGAFSSSLSGHFFNVAPRQTYNRFSESSRTRCVRGCAVAFVLWDYVNRNRNVNAAEPPLA
ncbi:uncharacterized protein LACBIDRAFT_308037 [Laccaria bicolor S238N-H82]|uniref:Predicted protein n=1 Tax=Laccaria bicolor (strain S238N-H82 / ATCC MYA-4686) TaxID=486041 RepID=B0DRH5_LACBS|nr:uncharacterized protein LACBIDRAFT_308037 [Laccaria bicolor S238N-H82]EDR02785.1 predicted protein [Laccaria bicolor S238N-H82]|eukprot:XP_001886495.1 predicted protein [Laccaria bicolor S238N-H82]